MKSEQEERLWTIIKRLETLLNQVPKDPTSLERERYRKKLVYLQGKNRYLKQQIKELEKALNFK